MWYKLAEANGLASDVSLDAGAVIHVPAGVMRASNTASTFQPYDPNAIAGNDPELREWQLLLLNTVNAAFDHGAVAVALRQFVGGVGARCFMSSENMAAVTVWGVSPTVYALRLARSSARIASLRDGG